MILSVGAIADADGVLDDLRRVGVVRASDVGLLRMVAPDAGTGVVAGFFAEEQATTLSSRAGRGI